MRKIGLSMPHPMRSGQLSLLHQNAIISKTIGVKTVRGLTLKNFSILINIDREHRLTDYRSWTKHKYIFCDINTVELFSRGILQSD